MKLILLYEAKYQHVAQIEIDKVRELRNAGRTIDQIAQEMGISGKRVGSIISRYFSADEKQQPITQAEIDKIRELRNAGHTSIQIAQEMGVSVNRVRNIINYFPADEKQQPVTQAEIDKIRELRNAGHTKVQIAKEIGISTSRVKSIVKRYFSADEKRSQRHASESEINRAQYLWSIGATCPMIAYDLGIADNQARTIVQTQRIKNPHLWPKRRHIKRTVWHQDKIEELKQLIINGFTYEEMAEYFEKTVASVVSAIEKHLYNFIKKHKVKSSKAKHIKPNQINYDRDYLDRLKHRFGIESRIRNRLSVLSNIHYEINVII